MSNNDYDKVVDLIKTLDKIGITKNPAAVEWPFDGKGDFSSDDMSRLSDLLEGKQDG